MSRVDDLVRQMGQPTQGSADIVINAGDPEQALSGGRWKLSKANIERALKRMPEDSALWSQPGVGEYDAKQGMKEELWRLVEKKVQTFQYAPDGKTLIEVK